MPKLDLSQAPVKTGSAYPEPYNAMMAGRSSLRLGDLGGLSQFGANLVTLQPGALASMRHWHENEDEFIIVTKGDLVLVDDHGDTAMGPGDCAAFPAGDPNGHHLVNRSDQPASFLVVGTRAETEVAHYSDVDMIGRIGPNGAKFTRKDGSEIQPPEKE